MDVGPPMSRDPRLFNRGSRPSLPSRLSQTEVPHQPLSGLPDAQNKVPSDYFISGITDLVQTAVFAATSKTEREQLQKKRSTTEDLLQKAKAHSGFPSTVEFFQHTRKDEDSVLASINKKIKDYETNYKRLEADLKNTWAAHTASQVSRSEDKVPQMQHDLKLANDKISNLYGDIAGLIDRNKAADVELRNLQEILSAQKKGFADYTNSLGLLSRDLNDQLKKQNEHSTQLQQLEAATKEPETGATSEIKTALDDVSLQYKTLEQKTAGFIEKLGSLSSSYQRISALPDQVNQTLKDQQQKLDGVVNSQAANPKLENVVDILNHKLEDLEEIQRTKDDLQFAEMEDIKKILNTATEEHKKLSGYVKELSLVPVESRVDTLFTDMMRVGQKLDAVSVGLHSLESRYNNLSTEYVVQQMYGAMRELYPSLDEVPPLKSRMEQLESSHIRTTALTREELSSLTTAYNNLSQSVGNFFGRNQWLSEEGVRDIQSRLNNLGEQQKNMNTEFGSKKTADQTFMQEIERECESLDHQLTSLHDALKTLSAECAQAKSEAANDEDLRSLELRIAVIEKNTNQSYEKLKMQFDMHLPERVPRGEAIPRENTSRHYGDITKATKSIPLPPPNPSQPETIPGAKFKRPHTATFSDDERPPVPTRSNSTHSQESTASPTIAPGERRKKKKKKRKLDGEAPIQLDDK